MKFLKPSICPYCKISTDAPIQDCKQLLYNGLEKLIGISLQCTACEKNFIALYFLRNKSLDFYSVIPLDDEVKLHEGLSQVSPRFAALYAQGKRAEARGDIDIAAVGYRTALEVLIKDYAIEILHADSGEAAGKSLSAAIREYVTNEAFNAADVIRIIGNDYTHYTRKHSEVDFQTFKHYFETFLNYMAVDYDMKNPPVHR